MKEVRFRYLKEHIPGPSGPFAEISGWTQGDAKTAIDKASKDLKVSLDEMLRKVQDAFERMKKKKENDTPQERKFRVELHQLVAEVKRILNGVARESLDLCKQFR